MGRDEKEFQPEECMTAVMGAAKSKSAGCKTSSSGVDLNPQCSATFLGPKDRSQLEGSEQNCRQ